MFRSVIGAAALAAASAAVALPAAADDFYDGKTINFLVGGGVGGNADIDARLIVKYMVEHIPGKPRSIIRNIESGSGGIVSINHFGQLSKRDGTEVLIGTVGYTAQLLKNPALQVKYSDLNVVGGFGQPSVVYVRKDTPPGINSVEDFFKVTEPVRSVGYVAGHDVDLHLLLTMDMLKLPHKHVTGFQNSAKMHLALLQGEMQMGFDSLSGYRSNTEATMIKPGIAIPLWQSGIPQDDGTLKRSPALPDIPTFLEVYKMKFGQDAMPPADLWDAYLLITAVRSNLVRAVFLPPDAPQEATDTLRKAWADTMQDPKFLAEYQRIYKADPDYSLGPEGQKSLEQDQKADPASLDLLAKYSK